MIYSRFIFFILLLIFLRTPTVSQNSSFQFSELDIKDNLQNVMGFISASNQYFLFLASKKSKDIHVCVYDSTLNKIHRNSLNLDGQRPLKIELLNDVPVLFSTITNQDGEQELYAHEITLKGELSSTLLITKNKNHGGYLTHYKLAVSKNNKHIIVLVEQPHEKEKHEKISILTLKLDLSIKKKTDHTLDLISKNKRINVPIITNKGIIYILKRYWQKGNRYYLYLMEGSEFSEIELKLRSRKIADVKYVISKDDELLLSGFFTSPLRFNFEGVFTFKFNNSLYPEYRKEAFFSENIITTFKNKKEIREKGFGLDHFKAKDLLLDTLGNQYLIAEHHLFENNKSEQIHSRKGVVVFKFTKSGSYVWARTVLTNQIEHNKVGGWTSSVPFMMDNLYLMYNKIGHEKSNKIDHIYGQNALFGTQLVKFSNTGTLVNQPVLGMHEGLKNRFALYPKLLLQEDLDVFVLTENAQRDNFRIVRMSLLGE